MAIAALGVLAILAATGFYDRSPQFDQARIAAMVDAAQPYAADGCIYIYNGPSIVYLLTHSCLPSRYSAPDHLSTAGEARATDATRSMAELVLGWATISDLFRQPAVLSSAQCGNRRDADL